MAANTLYQQAKERVRNELAKAKQQPRNTLVDTARGALMGLTTDTLGYIPDAVGDFMRPFGYNVPREQVIGGSDWWANKLTSPNNSLAETTGRTVAGLFAPGPEDAARLAGLIPKRAPVQEITTYHGSPHRINNVDEENPVGKFDLSKIGTGEGAQAYGHGIYLAENPDVAKSYVAAGGARSSSPDMYAAEIVATQGSKDKALAYLRHILPPEGQTTFSGESRAMIESAIKSVEGGGYQNARGHFYTVDLPDEHVANMLDWDAPLSQQPEAVRKALRELPLEPDTQKALDFAGDNLSGSALYDLLAQDAKFGSRQAASEYLRSIGIPGIRYMDGNSRGYVVNLTYKGKPYQSVGKDGHKFQTFQQAKDYAAEKMAEGFGADVATDGTRNFVVFDPSKTKILKRE